MHPSRAALLALLLTLVGCSSQPATPSAANTAPAEPQSAATSLSRPARARPTATPGFDFYLLNISWSPEYCHSHPTATECAAHPAFELHGLWPQNTNGTYPENCSSAPGPANPAQYADIYPDPGLLQHEWSTHGTCSGLAPDAFFQNARKAFRSVTVPPTLAHLTKQTSLPPAQIVSLVTASNASLPASSVAISCGGNFLTAIEVCLDKNLHAMACPAMRSCAANTVRIPPP